MYKGRYLHGVALSAMLVLTGCVTPAADTRKGTSVKNIEGLSAQELETGACGLFFWDENIERKFVFFQKQGDNVAQFYWQNAQVELTGSENSDQIVEGLSFVRRYQNASGEKIELRGSAVMPIDGGQRFADALIKITRQNGWEEFLPVSGVYICR